MAKYMFDAGRWTAAESWRVIRTVRADPPAKIKRILTGERKVVFQAALEQAQQQFAAAGSIGYESRPLNLFYGLSQAGRALAAASRDLSERQTEVSRRKWESTSHGLNFVPTGSLDEFWKQAVSVKPTMGDTFSRASLSLDSPYGDVGTVELGSLIAQFPEFTLEWRSFKDWPRALNDGGSSWLGGTNPTFAIPGFGGRMTAEDIRSHLATPRPRRPGRR